ncbi:hypothetical protein IVB45_17385 [Bradyrhizobium sp. 4]|uniref:hypothetical protein n=1 Tax=unclassified Bradyrhizobium TaxID=2631580 RepID=UPI001FF77777|nr:MULTISPECIES: hypothetical protein [unclassified Bradyrhizobium]MCK1402052.1 hypothetical protein [Bradyrhizobium sp. 39]MCK1751228.1 hypothetical protein [Bradyrhizobium sp. 135]UPJ38483.1 hypothetical protein IVB45_17385 [Bradyrhizobium sp. 4]
MQLAEILTVYRASDDEATRQLYAKLNAQGHAGDIAVNLLRACKCSERAKLYRRGPGHRSAAYDRKDWSIRNLVGVLARHDFGWRWGWAIDADLRGRGDPHHHIVYLELPTGQVSFHVGERYEGPDYAGAWDGVKEVAADRICRFAAQVFVGDFAPLLAPADPR